MLRSLNSLGVVVADSTAATRDREATTGRATLHRLQ